MVASGAGPSHRDGPASRRHHVTWHPGAPGVEWSELLLRGSGEARRTRMVVVRLDPHRVDLSLVPAFTRGKNWTLGDVERESGTAQEAFQSYPMLLRDGVVPVALRQPGSGVDLAHRDARLALGTLADGRVLIALTRFDALGRSLRRLPFGLTTPEMAAVMGALGCRQALLLDGGISGQLMLRQDDGSALSWPERAACRSDWSVDPGNCLSLTAPLPGAAPRPNRGPPRPARAPWKHPLPHSRQPPAASPIE